MTGILWAVGVVAGLGLLAGLILAIASVAMAVPVDEKVTALREALPGANCGACGFSGCDGYAEAMAHDGAPTGLCSPGGDAVAAATAAILGVSGGAVEKKAAVVRCGGCESATSRKLAYHGIPSCAAANQFYGGDWACPHGCLGYGDCAAACPYGAIKVENGLARVDLTKCVGCGICAKTCPKGLIAVLPADLPGVVLCSSHEKGAAVRKACTAGCIGCMKCTKVCEHEAITVQNFLASIKPEACVGCGKCAEACPVGCIDIRGMAAKAGA
ncbi:MAG: RnfABCDGE type electron transport complex subunit B [Acutalibacteraceae bacterium]|jgi:electron transport complex protein RnfB